ncbi:helix-turn-helix domain-containing protein [Thiocapsa sp. UBA6158]|jgi:excisionase family DNA binding protein|uniref:helix-turn-helix domain-containing protein n=1 Tax=Thiocapsa sp. UBA6158 TaxID=1947692 RepID=UPI0025F7364E|nr:helix-turn-helix domain-containing protein [Thiocapsa sp. UBA6158]
MKQQPRSIEPVGLSIEETIKATGLGRTSIYKEIAEGRLKTYRVGRRRFVAADALRQWVDSHQQRECA